MADVAQMAGVSVMTVSRTYQDPGRVSAEARARIIEAAAALGYVPNRVAAQLSSRRSRVVATTVPLLSEVLLNNALQSLSGVLRGAGYQLLITECGRSEEEERRAVAALLGHRPDALVTIGVDHGEASRTMIRATDIPVVALWNLDRPAMDMAVGFSDRRASRCAVEYLIATGRRRIGYIDFPGPAIDRFTDRRQGFLDAMAAAGLPADLATGPTEAPVDIAWGREAARRLMARDPGLDALFCAVDLFAAGALFEAMAEGWSVPGRMAVVGFGDFDVAAAVPPGITTVRINADGIGRAAGEMVLTRLGDGAEAAAERQRDLGFELVLRGSA